MYSMHDKYMMVPVLYLSTGMIVTALRREENIASYFVNSFWFDGGDMLFDTTT